MVDLKSVIDVTSRLSNTRARKLLAEIFNVNPNFISYTKHAFEQMSEDDLKTGDILNVLKAGKIYNDPEFENGSYRYRVETRNIVVVIAFRKRNYVVVITTWRKK